MSVAEQSQVGKYQKEAFFIDRDGVVNENVKNLVSPDQFVMINGVPEAVKRINDAGYLVIIVTNQPIIAKGFCTFEDMDQIHSKMKRLLSEGGARVDDIYLCPHHPERGFEGEVLELKIDCDCRKPKPGLLLRAAADYNINLKKSWVVGDSPSDIAAGIAAGCKTVFLTGGGGSGAKHEEGLEVKADRIYEDLKQAVYGIL